MRLTLFSHNKMWAIRFVHSFLWINRVEVRCKGKGMEGGGLEVKRAGQIPESGGWAVC